MKVLVILLLVGCASCTLLESFQQESRNVINSFVIGMEEGTPLHTALGIEDSEDVRRFERDLREELAEHIKQAFDKALKLVNEAIDSGKDVNNQALILLKQLHDKIKDLNIESSEIKDGIEHLKTKVDEHLKQILTRMGVFDKRSMKSESIGDIVGDLNLRTLLIKLKEMITNKMDVESVKESLAKIIGRGTQTLCTWLTSKGKEKVLNFFDRLLDEDFHIKKRADEDRIKEIKNYLENLDEDIENKLKRFKNWLHDLIRSGLTKSEDSIHNAREILKKLISQSKNLSKNGLADVLVFLRRNEKEFGQFYEDFRNIILARLKKEN